ncbi:MAG: hypothetical protein WCB93_03775 [Gallionella sp.]
MNLMTKILNALAFANVGNQGEFNALLRQVDLPSAAGQNPAQRGPVSAVSDTSSAPEIRHAQGAL